MTRDPLLSIVVPVYNEEASISPFLERVNAVLSELACEIEIVFVNDGSSDRTFEVLQAARESDPRIKIVSFSRNFGKEQASSAGLKYCQGAAVVLIDVDLQDPPELIKTMVEKWRDGYEVVYGRRAQRVSDTQLKKSTARWFYKVFNRLSDVKIPENVSDFRLMDRRVVDVVNQLHEKNRFMKGLFSWVGFRQTGVDFERAARNSGDSKWKYWDLWNFAVDGITAFSSLPLRVWSYLGAFVSFTAFIYAFFLIAKTLLLGRDTPGYASLMVCVLFLGGIQLLSLGVIGEYLARIFQEVKGRPSYVVRETCGFDDDGRPGCNEI